MAVTTCIFDAYGTLFDVSAAARGAAGEPGAGPLAERWPMLAADWRRKQLEYTWLRAITGAHVDFWVVTQHALDWALEAQGMDGNANLRARLLKLYWQLSSYPEVAEVLSTLKSRGFNTGILSNGSPAMLEAAVGSAGIGALLDDCLSVESVGVFKPAPAVYAMVTDRFDCARDNVLFVSSNGWDAAGAAGFGFFTVWVNRAGDPMDRLDNPPDRTLTDLLAVPDIASKI